MMVDFRHLIKFYDLSMKRLFDILSSLIAIIIFLPFSLIIILILRTTGEGEIFYFQERVGKDSKIIRLIKFATMKKNSPNMGAGDITVKSDPRVLPFGKILRKTKLNEVPQLLNVLSGDMSVVGPRPLVVNQHNMIPEKYKKNINKLKPGLSSIGSIIFRDEERFLSKNNDESNDFYRNEIVPFKASIENWYFHNNSFFNDIMIIIFTISSILFPNSNHYKFFFRKLPKHKIFNP